MSLKSRLPPQRGPRFGHLPGAGAPRGIRVLRALVRLRPAAPDRTGAAARVAAAARRGAAYGGEDRAGRVRRVGARRPPSTCPKDARRTRWAHGIPVTYVPARNTIFLSFALAWAEVLERRHIFHRGQRAGLFRLSRLPAGVHRGLRADGEPGDQGGSRGHARRSRSTRRCCGLTKAEIVKLAHELGLRFRPDPQLLRSRSGRPSVRAVRFLPAAAQGLRRGGH